MTHLMRNFAQALCMNGMVAGTAFAQNAQPHINVTGTGTVTATPDMAHITLGVVQEANTAAAALDAMSMAMDAVLDNLRAAGIAPEYMQTGTLRLDPRYSDYAEGKAREVIGYSANTDVNVQVYDLGSLGMVMDAAVLDGANQMNGLRFDVADRAPFLTGARQAAVADAVAKAQVYTQAAGATLGPIMMISEGQDNSGPMPMMAEMAFDSASRSVPIAAGEMSISATISMIWAIE